MRRIAALIVALSAAALTPAAQTPSPPRGRGVISGRVVDTFGDPVINARIVVETRSGENTTRGVAASETDDRGEYRIGRLPSGSYLISLLRLQVMAPQQAGRPPQRIYYPGAAAAADAELISLEGADERAAAKPASPLKARPFR